MAGAVNTGYTFLDTDVITSTKMNNIIDETVMTSYAIIGSTLAVSDGKLRVNTSGITANELATGSVTTTAILDANVTTAKIADSNVTTAKIADSNVTTAKIADSNVTLAKLSLPSGFPIQIAQAVKTDTQTVTNSVAQWIDITGLSVTLTRAIASASGKVRIQGNIATSSTDASHGVAIRLLRDGVTIDDATGDADGSRLRATSIGGYNGTHGNVNVPFDFIDDSPGSNATVTYKVQARIYSARTAYINRSNSDINNGDYSYRTISSITLTELAP
jgi:hypothetical protein